MEKKTKVICFGTFDLLHLGHVNYFQQAKKHGDYLIVIIARDKTKSKQKKEIIFSEKERKELVQNLRLVDEALLGDVKDYFKIILEKKPDILCLGHDCPLSQKELTIKLNQRGINPKILRMKPYQRTLYQSKAIKRRIIHKT